MGIQQPGQGDVHIDRPLTNISLAFLQARDGFVADRAFPTVPVGKQTDKYFTYDRGAFNRDEMQKRAAGTESAGATYTVSTDNYGCDVYGLHVNVADQMRANADSPLSPDREATEFLSLKALIRRERSWAAQYFATTVWTNERAGVASSPTGTQFLRWNDAASDPIKNVDDMGSTIQESTGFRPNRLILGRRTWDAIKNHPDIIGRIDRGQTEGAARAARATVAAIMELDEVLVMDGIVNTAIEGAANAHSFIGGKHALLVYAAPNPGLMVPSAGYTFTWSGLLGSNVLGTRISRFRMEHLKSDRIEIEQAFDHKKVAADLGGFFLNAVS